MVNFFKNFIIIQLLLIFNDNYILHCNIHKEIWSFPINYSEMIERAQNGDRQSQEEIANLIYKGVRRYPSEDDKDEKIVFAWLNEINTNDSFEKKVARLFFTHGTSKDAQNTLTKIKDKANKGDLYAQRTTGSLYFYTELVEPSLDTGITWYLKAAKQGHARAQMSLALRYLRGAPYIKKNIEEGMKWLKLASDAGLPEAQFDLSIFYVLGKNIPQDVVKGYDLFVLAAKNGDSRAKKNLALFPMGILDSNFSKFCNVDVEKID